jgi:hypothetical protein
MSSDRTWVMTLDIVCSVETCPKVATASCCDTTPIGATEGAKKILRYRGWLINRRDNTCPEHSTPIPACLLCGVPTPLAYGHDMHHITKVSHACDACYRKAFSLRMAERFMNESQQRNGGSVKANRRTS